MMRVELRDYQDTAVESLLFYLDEAIASVGRRPHPRAIAFAAPTGAGKTVMMAATIEALLAGGEIAARAGVVPDPMLTFLWLSDRPDLNEQSRRRILNDANGLTADRFVTIENDFDRDTLAPGIVYFLNFQKLRSGSLLTRLGDSRSSTIWEIIAATQTVRPGKLIVVIDEAHRGLSSREQAEAQTIASHFVRGGQNALTIRGPLGESARSFPPVQIVVGVSATPERFNAYLTTEGGRTRAEVQVLPQSVRGSGLIKDRIVLVGPEDVEHSHGDIQWTLLSHACRKTQEVKAAWNAFTAANPASPAVVPALVIQVADGNTNTPTATPLDLLVEKVRNEWPDLHPGAIVHCFNGIGALEPVPGWVIPYREPSEISDDTSIQIVLFKTALNTGWDCPRAEVMMSFRTLSDRIAIAQLVGRMVRTPLGIRVPGDAILNSTYLYLPLFDQDNLQQVKDYLTSDAYEISAEVLQTGETQILEVRPGGESIFEALKILPTEVVAAERPLPDIKRLLKMCRLLEQDAIDTRATQNAVEGMMVLLRQEFAVQSGTPGFEERVSGRGAVTIAQLSIENGAITGHDVERAQISAEDINRTFRAASSIFADELGLAWLRERYDDGAPLRAKLEFLELLRSMNLIQRVEQSAARQYRALQDLHLGVIQALPEGRRDQYVALQRSGRSVQRALMAPERRIMFPHPDGALLQRGHLYVRPGTADECFLDLNDWERGVLGQERQRPDFVAFLRNLDRKRWALSFSYDFNGVKAGYPDFLIFRLEDGNIVTDILEPHHGEDSVAKAKGLARFAQDYGNWFGRIQMIRMIGKNFRRLSFDIKEIRNIVLNQVNSQVELISLFESNGS